MVKIPDETPTDLVLRLRNQGLDDKEIAERLRNQGYSPVQVSEALNQADIKKGVGGMEVSALPPEEINEVPLPPTPSPAPPRTEVVAPSIPESRLAEEDIQRLIESIIEERWQEVVSSIGDISIWKSKVEDELTSIKQEIVRVEERFSNLERGIFGRVEEYHKGMEEVGAEIKALEKVFEKILEPLTSNIKELGRITKEFKKK